jgi:hypothetical protein
MASQDKEGGVMIVNTSANTVFAATSAGTTTDESIPSTITLKVGGRYFCMHKSTLEDARFFRPYLEGRFEWWREEDGSFSYDGDPDIFAHILRYLRRPSVYPLFWTKATGFDYDLYHRLEDAAIDLQIEKLEEWIKTKTYLKAISVESSVRTMKLTDSSQFQSLDPMRLSGDVDIERKVFTRTKKVYLCPRGIPVHRGRQYACGLACQNARNGAPLEYDHETYLEVVSIYKKYIIDKSMCMEEI